jgi:ABC-2 type transport system ATP-binding protein
MEYAIEIEGLKKDFREGKEITHAVNGISLKIRRGEIFGLLGPNGSGKTTIINILSNLVTPDSGSVNILGNDILENPEMARSLCGVCAGGTSFLWDMTPREILNYYSLLFGLKSSVRKERVEKLIKDLGIAKFQNSEFNILSTGMKQKVAVAKSLLNDPGVLLLDEPTAGLDVEVAISIRKYIENIVEEKGTTVILTSHQLYEVEEMCNEIAIIDEGRLIAKGTIPDIRKRMKFPSVAYFCLDRTKGLDFLGKMKGVHGYDVEGGGVFVNIDPGTDVACKIIAELKRRGVGIIDMEIKKPTLEEVFLKIVRKGGTIDRRRQETPSGG